GADGGASGRIGSLRMTGLLGIENLTREEVQGILDRARDFQPGEGRSFRRFDLLRGRMVVNLFFEASTRTRTSFEIAAKRLRSNVYLLSKFGADIVLCGPASLLPPELKQIAPGVTLTTDMNEAIRDADVIMMLRVQLERQHEAAFPASEYFQFYGLRLEHLET